MYRNYLAALAVATLFSAASSVPAAEPLFADVVVAKAKGVEIRRSQLDDEYHDVGGGQHLRRYD